MQARLEKWQLNVKNYQSNTKDHASLLNDLNSFEEMGRQRNNEKMLAERIEKSIEKISPRYSGKSMDDFRIDYPAQEIVKKTAIGFMATFSQRLKEATNLLFLGKPGTGKTLLSLIMYQQLVRLGYSVHYESSLRFLRKLKDKNFESDAAFQVILNFYKNISFLIIDEAAEGFGGREGHLADWEKQMLFTLIDMRYSENLCTVIISNRSKSELIERLGERTVDRLSEKGICLAFNWQSYRQQ